MVNYVNKIKTLNGTQTIGGAQFDDVQKQQSLTLSSSFTIEAGGTKTFSLASYLPNDGHDYMVQIQFSMQTGTTSGNAVDAQICTGSTWTTKFYVRAGRRSTRTASLRGCVTTFEIPVLASDKAFTIKNGDGGGTGTYGAWCFGYTRLGTNGKVSNYIEKIKVPNNDLTVGGKFLSGLPVSKNTTLASNITIAANGTKTISLANWLPNDGYDYICYFNVTSNTGTTNGNSVTIRLSPGSNTNGLRLVCNDITRSDSNHICAGNIRIKVSANDRNITIGNTGNATSGNTTLYGRAYRRVGTNKLGSSNYVSNINAVPMGGSIADGQWVSKYLNVFTQVSFADQTEGDKTYTLNKYLPTNNELYEVMFSTYSRTGNTAGNNCTFWINGNGVSASQVGSYVNTRTASNEGDGKSGFLICKQDSSGNMTVSMDMTSSVATNACGLALTAYRRIGTNP